MKARRLIQDPNNKHQNIVFFGSYGVNPKEKYIELVFEETEQQQYACSASMNLYIDDNDEEEIYVDFNSAGEMGNDPYYAEVSWEGYKNNQKVQGFYRTDTNPGVKSIPIIEIYNEIYNIQKLDVVTNFKLTVCNPDSSGDARGIVVPVYYPEKASKLVYDKEKYYNPVLSQNGAKVYDSAPYEESVLFNYSTKQQGVKDSLIPRLSVIKGELWYAPSYGLPLVEKIKSKGIFDAIVVSYITNHPDVTSLQYFSSLFDNHTYEYNLTIDTVYGESVTLTTES